VEFQNDGTIGLEVLPWIHIIPLDPPLDLDGAVLAERINEEGEWR
jgi:hypothetical protein